MRQHRKHRASCHCLAEGEGQAGRARCAEGDLGQEAVGQALLIAAVSIGALSATQLSRMLINACQTMITALS